MVIFKLNLTLILDCKATSSAQPTYFVSQSNQKNAC